MPLNRQVATRIERFLARLRLQDDETLNTQRAKRSLQAETNPEIRLELADGRTITITGLGDGGQPEIIDGRDRQDPGHYFYSQIGGNDSETFLNYLHRRGITAIQIGQYRQEILDQEEEREPARTSRSSGEAIRGRQRQPEISRTSSRPGTAAAAAASPYVTTASARRPSARFDSTSPQYPVDVPQPSRASAQAQATSGSRARPRQTPQQDSIQVTRVGSGNTSAQETLSRMAQARRNDSSTRSNPLGRPESTLQARQHQARSTQFQPPLAAQFQPPLQESARRTSERTISTRTVGRDDTRTVHLGHEPRAEQHPVFSMQYSPAERRIPLQTVRQPEPDSDLEWEDELATARVSSRDRQPSSSSSRSRPGTTSPNPEIARLEQQNQRLEDSLAKLTAFVQNLAETISKSRPGSTAPENSQGTRGRAPDTAQSRTMTASAQGERTHTSSRAAADAAPAISYSSGDDHENDGRPAPRYRNDPAETSHASVHRVHTQAGQDLEETQENLRERLAQVQERQRSLDSLRRRHDEGIAPTYVPTTSTTTQTARLQQQPLFHPDLRTETASARAEAASARAATASTDLPIPERRRGTASSGQQQQTSRQQPDSLFSPGMESSAAQSRQEFTRHGSSGQQQPTSRRQPVSGLSPESEHEPYLAQDRLPERLSTQQQVSVPAATHQRAQPTAAAAAAATAAAATRTPRPATTAVSTRGDGQTGRPLLTRQQSGGGAEMGGSGSTSPASPALNRRRTSTQQQQQQQQQRDLPQYDSDE